MVSNTFSQKKIKPWSFIRLAVASEILDNIVASQSSKRLARVPQPGAGAKGSPSVKPRDGSYHPFQVNLMDVKHLGLRCCASNRSVKILIPW